MEPRQAKKWIQRCAVGLAILGFGIILFHAVFGRMLVGALYEGATGTFLDQLIEGKNVHPVELYYAVADRAALRASAPLLLLSLGLISFSFSSSIWLLVTFFSIDILFIVLDIFYSSTESIHRLRFLIGEDMSYAEIFQYIKEIGIALLFLIMFLLDRNIIYLIFMLIFFYIFLDDYIKIHEELGFVIAKYYRFSQMLGMKEKDFGELTVFSFFGAVFFILLIIGYNYSCMIIRKISLNFIKMLIILAMCGVIFDMIHNMIDISSTTLYKMFDILEDGGEMLTMSVIAWYAHLLVTNMAVTHGEATSG